MKPQNFKTQKKQSPTGLSKKITAPVAMQRVTRLMKPVVTNTTDGCIVKNRELVQDINGSVPFALQIARFINPGTPSMFPWLSNIAPNYELYRFKKLKYTYEPFVSTTASGTVMMAIDYDADDTQPLNKQQLMAYDGATRTAPWGECELVANRQDQLIKKRVVAPNGVIPINTDAKLYHLGALDVATQSCSITTGNGEIYAEYECEFFIPQLSSNIAGFSSGQATATTGLANNSPLGSAPTILGAINVTGTNPNVISFAKAGKYLLDLTTIGTGVNGGANVTGNGTSIFGIASNIFTTTGISAEVLVEIKNILTDSINLSTGSSGTISSGTLRVAPYNFS